LSALTGNIDFARIKREADSLAYIKYQDSLQRAILFVETENPAKPVLKAVVPLSMPEKVSISKPKVAVQPKLALSELKKKTIVMAPAHEIPAPEKMEMAVIVKSSPAADSGTPAADGAAQTQPQADKKKKFLFFSKKHSHD
jgi:hypothetical protein